MAKQSLDNLKISISGVRGLCPEYLDRDMVEKFVRSFCAVATSGPIVIAWDGRNSGQDLFPGVREIVAFCGREVLDIGIAPLPTAQMAVHYFRAAGAVVLTASHNPEEYNGLKFLNTKGEFIDAKTLDTIVGNLDTVPLTSTASGIVRDVQEEAFSVHIDALTQKTVPTKRTLCIAVDCNNASGSYIVPALLERLGHRVVRCACDTEQPFWHTPEPLEKNMGIFLERLKTLPDIDLAIAVDPDADRVVFFNEKGEYINEEQGLALFAQSAYEAGYSGGFVVNLSTSAMSRDIAQSFGGVLYTSSVGEKNVVDMMQKTNSLYGGEGGGGMIDGSIHYGRDSLVGILHILNLLQISSSPLSVLVEALPKYHMIKHNIAFSSREDIQRIYKQSLQQFPDATINQDDGLRLDFHNGQWVHLRPSNTEPLFRVYIETRDKESSEKLLDIISKIIQEE